MAEKIFETEAEVRERKLGEKLESLAAAGNWDGVIEALDRYDARNDRRHREKRDGGDISRIEGNPDDLDYYRLARGMEYHLPCGMNYYLAEDWDDVIFSQTPEDLYQLVSTPSVSAAIRVLTPKQKEVLLYNIVYGVPTKDLAHLMGCSVRNITKQRQCALEKIRKLVTGSKGISKKQPLPQGLRLGLKCDKVVT